MKKPGERELSSLNNEHQFVFAHCGTFKMKRNYKVSRTIVEYVSNVLKHLKKQSKNLEISRYLELLVKWFVFLSVHES